MSVISSIPSAYRQVHQTEKMNNKGNMVVKVTPHDAKETRTEDPCNSESFFKYSRILLLLGGMYPGKTPNKKSRTARLEKVFTSLIATLYLGALSVFCCAIYVRICDSKEVTRLVSFFLVMISSLYTSSVYSFLLPKLLPDLEKKYTNYEGTWQFQPGFIKWIKQMERLTVTFPGIYTITSPSVVFLVKKYPEIQCNLYPACDFAEPWKTVGFVISAAAFLVSNLQWQVVVLVFNSFAFFLLQEFRKNVRMFTELDRPTTDSQDRMFSMCVGHYDNLVGILNKTSDCVQHCTFLFILMFLPLGCSFFYTVISKGDAVTTAEIVFLCSGMVWTTLLVGSRLVLEALVCSKAHEPLQFIWQIDKKRFSDRGLHNVSLFVSRLTGDSVGYSVYGLFSINRPTLLALFGTLVTYIIIVVQFRPTDTSSCDILLRNMTYCSQP